MNTHVGTFLCFNVAKPVADPWYLQQTGKKLVKVWWNVSLCCWWDWPFIFDLLRFELGFTFLTAPRKTEWAAVCASCCGGDSSWRILQSRLLLSSGILRITVGHWLHPFLPPLCPPSFKGNCLLIITRFLDFYFFIIIIIIFLIWGSAWK